MEATLPCSKKCVTLQKKKAEQTLIEREKTMARPLDGIGLLTYFRRLKLSKEAQKLVTEIRNSPPSRTPGARRGKSRWPKGAASESSPIRLPSANSCEPIWPIGDPLPKREVCCFSRNRQGILRSPLPCGPGRKWCGN